MLDRSPGGHLDKVIKAAIARTMNSIAVGNNLLAEGFPSPCIRMGRSLSRDLRQRGHAASDVPGTIRWRLGWGLA